MLTGLLTQETTTFDGKYYQLKDARNEPKGPQQPHPPICIGGSGEKRTLQDHRAVRRPLELRRRHARGVRPQARRAGRPLRRHRPRPEGDHAVGARAAGRGARLPARWSTTPPRSARRASTSRSSTCRRRTTPRCWSRWPRPSAIRDCSPTEVTADKASAQDAFAERGSASLRDSPLLEAVADELRRRLPNARSWPGSLGSARGAETMTRRFFPSACAVAG